MDRNPDQPGFGRPGVTYWPWIICGMMLLATMLNYMDRVLLNQAAKQIKIDLAFATFSWSQTTPGNNQDHSETNYSLLEGAFGICYALGALFFGWAADRYPVVRLYPLCVAGWSLAGIGSGLATDYPQLLASRALLGFFEAANWPCGVVTTRLLMTRERRSLGNGIFHGGGALGAMLTPLLLLAFSLPAGFQGGIGGEDFRRMLEDRALVPNWRLAFQVVGILGFAWAIFWVLLTEKNRKVWKTGSQPTENGQTKEPSFIGRLLLSREFWILLVTVCSINATWHLLRVWLPLFMQEAHDYTLGQLSLFSMAYYLMADLGAMGAGVLVLWFSRKWGVDHARVIVFGIGSLLCLQTLICPKMEDGWILRLTLWSVGMGSMCLFPVYFAQTQEVSARHSGKITGIMGFFCWFFLYFLQTNVGSWLDHRREFLMDQGIRQGIEEVAAKKEATRMAYIEAIPYAGIPPIIAFSCLLFWPRKARSQDHLTGTGNETGTL